MAQGIFVTATDTGIGKTVVSAALIVALNRCGIKTGAMKPVETGCIRKGNTLEPADGKFLKQIAGMDDPIDSITPLRFESPVAPYVASKREGIPVELDRIFDSFNQLSAKYDFMVVEGIGGVLVPITVRKTGKGSKTYFVIDMIKELKLPAIVVAAPVLGTINHTLLTVSQLLNEGIDVAGVVINCNAPGSGSPAENTNAKALTELCPVPIIGIIPCLREISEESIKTHAAACLETAAFAGRG
jgi:dethiobiotin synthetase